MTPEEVKKRTELALKQMEESLANAPPCNPEYSGLAKACEHEGFEPLEWAVDPALPQDPLAHFFVIKGL